MSKKKKKKNIRSNNFHNNSGTINETYREERNTAKKDVVLKNRKGLSTGHVVAIVAILITSSIALYVSQDKGQNYTRVASEDNYQARPDSPRVDGDEIVYNANLFNDGKARYFQYKDGNTVIKYFILKSSDGVIRAAFDACDVCWRAGKGYMQSGDNMVCRNCGQRFASVKVNVIKGGCNPAPLKRSFDKDKVVIKIQDIIEGRQYFNFAGRG